MLVGALAFSSCSMDEAPFGKLDDQTAINSAQSLRQFRNQLYSNMRTVTSGAWLYRSDIAMDEFHGLISNGNREGVYSNGSFTSSDADLKSMWQSSYNVIAKCNSILEHAAQLSASDAYSESDKVDFARYAAEAHFVRAYMYFWLADHYCKSYTQTDPAAEHSGLPLTTTYNPTGDVTAYPSRSTLDETFELIENDIKDAISGLQSYEASGAKDTYSEGAPTAYVTSSAAQALQARVALVKGDWATAAQSSEAVINSGKYQLTGIADYANMWTNDEGSEIIYQPIMSPTELGGSNGTEYISSSETTADYIPTFGVLKLYGDGDVRFDAFFKAYQELDVEGVKYFAFVLNKFPGNTALRTGTTNNLMNMTKVFRLSEMYLIAAEAEARQNNVTAANKYLKEFLTNRIEGYSTGDYSANTILPVILEEREKEFVGEGLRMMDIRRLGQGFERYATHDENPDLDNVVVKMGQSLKYDADDYRLTWPIPKEEIDANPNLAGQQNPGY